MDGKALFSLVAATAAEVSGIAYWYEFLLQDRLFAAYFSLMAGESVELALLAALIITAADAYPRRSGRVGAVLVQTGLVIFSEAFLWFIWIWVIGRCGFFAGTAILLVTMHVKHTAAVSFFHGRSVRDDLWDRDGIAATVLEVGGATAFYVLSSSGRTVEAVVVLGICIGIEHTLQFRAAGIIDKGQIVAVHS